MRRAIFTTIATVATAAAAVTMGSAPAALAATDPSGDTPTTFTITSTGVLAITVPVSADLGSQVTTAGTLTGSLGSVEVLDGTTPDDGTWTTTVAITTPFNNGGTAASDTIPDSNLSYAPGACTPGGPGTGTFTPGSGGAMTASQTAMVGSALFGDTTCTWTPSITVTLDGSPAGTYSGTITHSVTGT